MADTTSPLAADALPPQTRPSKGVVIAAALGAFLGKIIAAAIVLYVAGVVLLGLDLSFSEFVGATWLLAYASS